MIFDRSSAGHPSKDGAQRLHGLPGESGVGLSSAVQSNYWKGAEKDLQHSDWSVPLSPCVCTQKKASQNAVYMPNTWARTWAPSSVRKFTYLLAQQ